MKKLLIDCSFISTTDLNTGIQRVVRKVLENIETHAKESPFEPVQVLLQNNKIYNINNTEKDSAPYEEIVATKNDILLLLDSTWHLDTWGSVYQAKLNETMVIAVIYDLIPISHPYYCDANLVRLFNSWFETAIEYVDGYIAISHTVEKGVLNFLQENYPEKVQNKQFNHFLLGADFKHDNRSFPSSNIKKELSDLYYKNNNIYLVVCTIEPRKNHTYLLDTFDALWQKQVNVTLNIVGKVGWMVDDIMERIKNHDEYHRRLFHWDDLDDEALNYCYKNSKMLLFPSYIEGFGLPIIESLNNRLPVMASDIPIHREVGGDKIGYFDLNNVSDLVGKIIKIENKGIPKALQVAEGYKWLTWSQSTQMLFERIIAFEKNYILLAVAPREKTFKEQLKSLPFIGWFLRWTYNLLRLNNLKHTIFMHQQNLDNLNQHIQTQSQQLNTQNQHIQTQSQQLSAQNQKINELSEILSQLNNEVDQKIAERISYQSVSFQQRIDQFIFDTKIELLKPKATENTLDDIQENTKIFLDDTQIVDKQ